jgi:hypothetical protein
VEGLTLVGSTAVAMFVVSLIRVVRILVEVSTAVVVGCFVVGTLVVTMCTVVGVEVVVAFAVVVIT